MKILLPLALALAVLIGGCNSSTSTDDSTPAGYYMTAKIEGAAFTANTAALQAVNTSGLLAISGGTASASVQQISLTIFGAEQGKTYSLGFGNTSFASVTLGLTSKDSYSSSLVGGSGSITISKLTATEVEGTFTFKGINTDEATKNVTEGKFRAKIN